MNTLRYSQIIAMFNKISGFTAQYKIFYDMPNKSTYQAYATFDRLKNKIYIINFNPITFGVA